MNACIEVKDLTKTFNGRVVVDKITFRVEMGAGLENVWEIAILLSALTDKLSQVENYLARESIICQLRFLSEKVFEQVIQYIPVLLPDKPHVQSNSALSTVNCRKI